MSIRINRVYTRSGDNGQTALASGERVAKDDLRVATYGDVDELNACLGCVKEALGDKTKALEGLIVDLQQELFDLGAELATSTPREDSWQTEARHVASLEAHCDKYGDNLPELTSFILPGGSVLAAELHRARTVARRAERTAVSLAAEEGASLNPEAIKYLNRLSDLLFILARWALVAEGASAPLWVPEAKRSKS